MHGKVLVKNVQGLKSQILFLDIFRLKIVDENRAYNMKKVRVTNVKDSMYKMIKLHRHK